MIQIKRAWRQSSAGIFLIVITQLLGGTAVRAGGPATVSVMWHGAGHQARPGVAAQLMIAAHTASGEPVNGALIRLHLEAPPSPFPLTTDIPMAEGKTLLVAEVPLSDGQAVMQYVPPIRGTYRIHGELVPAPGAPADFGTTPFDSRLSVGERPARVFSALLLVIFLLGIGTVSGVIVGRSEGVR